MQSDWFFDKSGNHRHPQFEKVAMPEHLVFKHVRFHNLIPHMLKHDEHIRIVGLVRDPRATISSFLNSREFSPDWNANDQWELAARKNEDRPEEFYGYERWKAATRIFLAAAKQYPDRFKLIRYVDLLAQTEDSARALFDFCRIDFQDSTRDFIVESKQRGSDDYGVFRQKQNDFGWRKLLNPRISNAIESDLELTENQDLRHFLDAVDIE